MTDVTKDQIEAWKRKYGNVFEVEVEDKKMFLRQLNRNEFGYITKQVQDVENALPAIATVFKGCFLGGDKEIIDDDRYFIAASKAIATLMDYGEALIKKL